MLQDADVFFIIHKAASQAMKTLINVYAVIIFKTVGECVWRPLRSCEKTRCFQEMENYQFITDVQEPLRWPPLAAINHI